MDTIDELVGYAKANAEAARTKDEQQTWAAHHRHALAVKAELAAAVAEAGRLRAALKPFAELAKKYEGYTKAMFDEAIASNIDLTDLRRARRALEHKPDEPSEVTIRRDRDGWDERLEREEKS